jgi:hypothetical protein
MLKQLKTKVKGDFEEGVVKRIVVLLAPAH